jgi:hypothetical protein
MNIPLVDGPWQGRAIDVPPPPFNYLRLPEIGEPVYIPEIKEIPTTTLHIVVYRLERYMVDMFDWRYVYVFNGWL